jgi:hypothetical protein
MTYIKIRSTFKLNTRYNCHVYAVSSLCLQPLACWDCGFEFHWEHGCLSSNLQRGGLGSNWAVAPQKKNVIDNCL